MNIWKYFRSIAILKSITAIRFVFRRGKDTDRVTMNSCTGWIKYIGRFHESRTYELTFDAQLSKGNVEVILSDKKKQQLMKLNRQFPKGRIKLDAKSRYYLRWDFKGATGKCELHW